MPIYVESILPTILAGLTSHVPAARNAYAHRLHTLAPRPRLLPQPSSDSSDDDEDTSQPQALPDDATATTERPSTFRLRALAMHGVTLHVGRGGTLPMASHTGLPWQPPLSGEGAWASSCVRSGPNPPQPVRTLPQWTAAAVESMGGTASPGYIPPSCINDYNVWLVAQLYLPPPDSIFIVAPITYTPAPGPPPVCHGLPTLLIIT